MNWPWKSTPKSDNSDGETVMGHGTVIINDTSVYIQFSPGIPAHTYSAIRPVALDFDDEENLIGLQVIGLAIAAPKTDTE